MNRDLRVWSAAASTAFLPLSLFAGLVSGADLSSDDKSFLKDAVEEGNAEIALANLALKKSTRPK